MIQSKRDYDFYLEADRIALYRRSRYNLKESIERKIILPDYIWNFQKLLRKLEFLKNSRRNIFDQIHYAFTLREFDRLSIKLGFYINPGNFGPGLCITHLGSIVINVSCRIGANCRIHPGVVIGTLDEQHSGAPKLGNNIYIGPGAKIYRPIEIADNIAVGANSVVNCSFSESGITIAGIPAKKVSDKGSFGYLIRATELMNKSNVQTIKRYEIIQNRTISTG